MFTVKAVFENKTETRDKDNEITKVHTVEIVKIHEADYVDARQSVDDISVTGYNSDGLITCQWFDDYKPVNLGGTGKDGSYSQVELLKSIIVENKFGKTTHFLKSPRFYGSPCVNTEKLAG